MDLKDNFFRYNKPLVYSVLTGLLYFLFCCSIEFTELTRFAFMTSMLFLPGITPPIATCYFPETYNKESFGKMVLHLIISVGIYHGSVWLHSAEGQIKYISILAGFCGSLFFLLLTKFLLEKRIFVWQIFIASTLSGLGFLPYVIASGSALNLGLAIFIWTIVNGWLLNNHFKATCRQQRFCASGA